MLRGERHTIVLLLALSACAGRDTPPDAWVFRPPEGQPSLLKAVAPVRARPPGGLAVAVLATVAPRRPATARYSTGILSAWRRRVCSSSLAIGCTRMLKRPR